MLVKLQCDDATTEDGAAGKHVDRGRKLGIAKTYHDYTVWK